MRISIKHAVQDGPISQGGGPFPGQDSYGVVPSGGTLNYLVVRGPKAGPLFQYKDGRCLSRQQFVDAVKAALQQAGVKHAKYNGHSFRIGAATAAASRGVEDSIIKTLGKWRSVAHVLCADSTRPVNKLFKSVVFLSRVYTGRFSPG